MTAFLKRHWRKALILPPVLAAVVVLVLAMEGRKPPVRAEAGEVARPARVIEVPRLDVIPRATGHGAVEPARVWQAVAEVSGRITRLHPDLERGALVEAGTELIRFDTADYDLALAEAEAQLAELDARTRNTEDSLAIEERSLAVLRRDLARKRDLRRSGTIAEAAVEAAERAVLTGEQQVQSLRSTLNLLPSQRKALETRAETARLNLDRTVVRAPFAMRIRSVAVELGQYAQRGQTLATGDGVETAEVTAQVPLARLLPLLGETAGGGAPRAGLARLEAEVRLRTGEQVLTWDARVSRLAETLDPKTRTAGIIVDVADPYGRAAGNGGPALVRGMFVEVAFTGPPREDRLVIPRAALHAGRRVHLMDADGRLEIRPVSIAWQQDDIAIIESGLEAGERLVITDLIPAVDGMLLAPEPDPEAAAALAEAATGAAP